MPDPTWFTRRGDGGATSLLGPGRVPKYDARVEAFGAVDEAQAAIGLARAMGCTERTGEMLLGVQRELHTLMAELAGAGGSAVPFSGAVTAGHVAALEALVDEAQGHLPVPREFVIPGDSPAGAALHLARTITRRAERLAVRLAHDGLLPNDQVLAYLNRLSSLLFVLACLEDARKRADGA